MRFELYDTKGQLRVVDCQVSIDELRAFLGEFKTHCATSSSAYEYTHFKNYMAKYHNIELIQAPNDIPARVDM